MRFVIVGKHDPAGMADPLERREAARAVLEKLGVKREFGGYLLGRWDFFDIVDAPDQAAMLGFSVWYAKAGYGRVETMPVLSYDDMFGIADKIS